MSFRALMPITSRVRTRVRKRFGLPVGLKEAAARSWIVRPSVQRLAPPSIYDPDDLQRIVGSPPGDTVAFQIARALGGMQQHGATIAYELQDAVLSKGHLFTHKLAMPLDVTPLPLLTEKSDRVVEHAVLVTNHAGIKYFGHWLADDLPRCLAALEIGMPVSTMLRPTRQQLDYMRILDLEVEALSSACFHRIVVLDDNGQNDYKRQRCAELTRRVRLQHTPQRNTGVMLLRGNFGNRRVLTNEREVADLVRGRGFKVLDPMDCTATEVIEACLDAKVVLGVEGSQLAHGHMWMSTSGTLVTLQPPNMFTVVHKDRCDLKGIRFAFIVGNWRGETEFSINTNRLQRLLDRVDAGLG